MASIATAALVIEDNQLKKKVTKVAPTQYIPQPPRAVGKVNTPIDEEPREVEAKVIVVRLRSCTGKNEVKDALALATNGEESQGLVLDCRGCRYISEEMLLKILPRIRFRLVTLDLTSLGSILTDRTLLALSLEKQKDDSNIDDNWSCVVLPSLKELALSGCPLFTDIGVSAIVRAANSRLQSLSLTGLEHCTDTSLTAVADNCTNLRTLLLGGNKYITDRGLMDVMKKCSKLEKLKIGGCCQISSSVLEYAESQYPELCVLYFLGDSSRRRINTTVMSGGERSGKGNSLLETPAATRRPEDSAS